MSDWRLERDQALLRLEREAAAPLRLDAAEALCALAFEAPLSARAEFVPAVVRLVSDQNADVRSAGLALGAEVLEPDEARALLVRFATDTTSRVRVEAVGRLADVAAAEDRGVFAAALQDELFAVRFEAARGMVALRHSAGIDVLLDALDNADFRFRAAAALARLGNPAALPRLHRAFHTWMLPAFDRTQLAGALASLGDPEGVAHLEKRAGKRWSMDRAMAVELLGEVKAKGAFERLSAILGDPKDRCRGAAARGLGRLGHPGSAGVLTAALDDAGLSPDVVLDVAEGLLMLGTPEARERVTRLQLSSPEDRAELASMLGNPP